MAHNEQMLVENSDKCGDECLYLPTREKGRVMSHNASLYKYRFSLQANVFGARPGWTNNRRVSKLPVSSFKTAWSLTGWVLGLGGTTPLFDW